MGVLTMHRFTLLDSNFQDIGFGRVHVFSHKNSSSIVIDINALNFTIESSAYDDYYFSIHTDFLNMPSHVARLSIDEFKNLSITFSLFILKSDIQYFVDRLGSRIYQLSSNPSIPSPSD